MSLAWRTDFAVARMLSALARGRGARVKWLDYMPVWPGARPSYPTAAELQMKLWAMAGVQNASVALRAPGSPG